jgi:phage baseplate assembly protein gpV
MDEFLEKLLGDPQQRREQTIPGLLTAKVTGRMADGLYELSYLGMGQNAPSAPARMMMPMAGNKRGTYFMPETGDEVVVGFDGGNPNMPIILGAVWNNQDQPPEQARPSPQNDVRTVVSRSGHELTFDDTSGEEKVKVRTQGGHELTLDDTPPGKVTLKTKLGSSIELDEATGTLRITSPLSIMLQSAAVTLAAGSISMGPPVPSPGGPPAPPPGPTVIKAPVQLVLESPLISLKGAAIELTTTGNALSSTVVIDKLPFGVHTHASAVPPAPTGPVIPLP